MNITNTDWSTDSLSTHRECLGAVKSAY